MLDAAPACRLDPNEREPGRPCVASLPSGCRQGTWHVVASYPKAERRAHAALHLKGYEPYLPLLTVRRSDRSYHTSALFPGYLFCRLDLRRPWYPIRYAPGVYGLILTNGVPSICPEAAVDALRASEPFRATPRPETTQWLSGALCSPANGMFQGHRAVILAIHPPNATIGLMFLGQLRQIRMPIDCLVPAGEQ